MMRHAVLFPVSLTAVLVFTLGGVDAEESKLSPWPPPRPGALALIPELMVSAALDRDLEIGGSAVGGGAQPSEFYLWAREAIESPKATEEQFLELTRHPHQAVRTVGMAGLAERGGPAAVARLRELMTSAESSAGHPGGCLDSWIFEAHTAWQFLTRTDYLCLKRGEPLLDSAQRLALAVEVLWRDDTAGVRGVPWITGYGTPAYSLEDEFLSGRLPLTLEALRSVAPSVPDYRLIKALGRLNPRLTAGFLISQTHRREAEPKVRLAAASALLHGLRSGPDGLATHRLFGYLKAGLNPLHPAGFGGLFLDISEAGRGGALYEWDRSVPRDGFDPVSKSKYPNVFRRTTMNQEQGWRDIDKHHSPFLLALALAAGEDNWREEAPWGELAAYLEAHAETQRLWREDWSAFGDTLNMLEILVRRDPLHGGREGVPEAGRKAVLEAAEKIRRLPLEPSPASAPK